MVSTRERLRWSVRGGVLRSVLALVVATGAQSAPAVAQDSGFSPTHRVKGSIDPCLVMRQGPGTDWGRLECLDRGTPLELQEQFEGWIRVRTASGRKGWVSRGFLVDWSAVGSFDVSSSDRTPGDAVQAELKSLRDENTRLLAAIRADRTELERQRQSELALRGAVSSTETLESRHRDDLRAARDTIGGLEKDVASLGASRVDELEEELSLAHDSLRDAQGRLVGVALSGGRGGDALEASRLRQTALVSELAAAKAEAALLRAELAAQVTPDADSVVLAENTEIESADVERQADSNTSDAPQNEVLGQLARWQDRLGSSGSAGAASLDPVPRVQLVKVLEPLAWAAEESVDSGPGSVDLVVLTREWARAWEDQRVADYLSFYTDDFVPTEGSNHSDWQALRRQRILEPSFIRITLSTVGVEPIDENHSRVRFTQSYQSDSLTDHVVKVLDFVWRDSDWKIVAERVDG